MMKPEETFSNCTLYELALKKKKQEHIPGGVD